MGAVRRFAPMKCYELNNGGSVFYTFTIVSENRVDVAKWFGYSIRVVNSIPKSEARSTWKLLVKQGYKKIAEFEVGEMYCGYNRS